MLKEFLAIIVGHTGITNIFILLFILIYSIIYTNFINSGAAITFYLMCTTNSTCESFFQVGGGLGFNFQIALSSPQFQASSITTIFSAANPIILASDDGLTISATPSAYLKLIGDINAPSSSTTIDASFSTNAEFDVYTGVATLTPSSGAGFNAGISLPQASLKKSKSSANSYNITFELIINVEWEISYGISDVFTIGADISTPFIASYGYTYNTDSSRRRLTVEHRELQSSGSGCSSTNSLTSEPNFTGFKVDIATVTYTVPAPAPLGEISLSSPSSSSECLFGNKVISQGKVIGIAVGIIAFIMISSIIARYYYYKMKKERSLASQDSTATQISGSVMAHRISVV